MNRTRVQTEAMQGDYAAAVIGLRSTLVFESGEMEPSISLISADMPDLPQPLTRM
jgi:hypothetical protein